MCPCVPEPVPPRNLVAAAGAGKTWTLRNRLRQCGSGALAMPRRFGPVTAAGGRAKPQASPGAECAAMSAAVASRKQTRPTVAETSGGDRLLERSTKQPADQFRSGAEPQPLRRRRQYVLDHAPGDDRRDQVEIRRIARNMPREAPLVEMKMMRRGAREPVLAQQRQRVGRRNTAPDQRFQDVVHGFAERLGARQSLLAAGASALAGGRGCGLSCPATVPRGPPSRAAADSREPVAGSASRAVTVLTKSSAGSPATKSVASKSWASITGKDDFIG